MGTRATRRWVAVVASVLTATAAAVGLLDGRGADRNGGARSLAEELRSLAGVGSVSQVYEPGSLLLPGSGELAVAMEPGAADEEVLAVVAAAYDAFGDFGRDSVSVGVEVGASEVRLHAERPAADAEDVAEVVRFALGLRAEGESVWADVYATQHEDLDDLAAEVRLTLRAGSGAGDVLARLGVLQRSGDLTDDTDLHVLAGPGAGAGAGLGGSRGLPTATDRRVWRELRAVEVPGGPGSTMHVEYGPQVYSGMLKDGHAHVSLRTPGRGVGRPQLVRMRKAHLRILRAHHSAFVYSVTVDGEDRMWLRGRGRP